MGWAALLSYISGFAALGFGVRCYQLALMKRNIFASQSTPPLYAQPRWIADQSSLFPTDPGGHVLSTAAFAGVGYFAYYAE